MIKVKVNEISATDDALINKLQKEINYLKNILKMKRKNGLAGGVQDIHTKLIHLQQENDRLRQNFVSINEVEKLISENKSMKLELQKLHTISYDNEFMGFFSIYFQLIYYIFLLNFIIKILNHVIFHI